MSECRTNLIEPITPENLADLVQRELALKPCPDCLDALLRKYGYLYVVYVSEDDHRHVYPASIIRPYSQCMLNYHTVEDTLCGKRIPIYGKPSLLVACHELFLNARNFLEYLAKDESLLDVPLTPENLSLERLANIITLYTLEDK